MVICEKLKICIVNLRTIVQKIKQTLRKPKLKRDTCTPLLIAALFAIARTWKQPSCPLTDECIKKLCTYTQWNIIQP